jgi:hypothetical protein
MGEKSLIMHTYYPWSVYGQSCTLPIGHLSTSFLTIFPPMLSSVVLFDSLVGAHDVITYMTLPSIAVTVEFFAWR